MPVYKNSMIDSFYYDDSPSGKNSPCEVRIDGKVIVKDYEYDGGRMIYEGMEVSPGHYELKADGGHASLHRF